MSHIAVCGIAGIANTNGDDRDADRLAGMIGMLRHRGPDDWGMHIDRPASLAHARLSIVDIAGGGQPMSNDDGSLWITFNGEIFNYVELRDELERRGRRFRTRSDTEVILRLYEEDGEDAVLKLNGQWAFGIWNARTETLFLSRDRLGVRPLFYTLTGGQLLFASEVKALFAHPGVSRDLDPHALDNIFTFWTTLPPRTIFRDVRELPPGHSLTWRQGQCSVTRHWRPDFSAAHVVDRTDDEWVELLESVLSDATRIRLRADVTVGAYVSGGLDSSVIATLASQRTNTPLRTFSIAFEDPEFDESLHQRRLARALGTSHRELRCSHDDICRVFPDVVWHAETPLLRTAPAPLFLLSKAVRDAGCTVVLTGEGADEVFGGYNIFKEAKVRRFWARFPESNRRASLLGRLYPHLPQLQRQSDASRRAFFHVNPDDLADPCFSHLPRWNLTSRLKLFYSDALRSSLGGYDSRADLMAQLPRDHGSWDPLSQAQHLEMAHLLPGYILSSQGDRVAMAHGVESRYPFLDPRVVDLAATLPATLKLRGLAEKYLLKRLARNVVPTPVWRRAKQPYRAPEGMSFMSRANGGYVDDMLSDAQLRRDGLFNPRAVSLLVRKFRAGKAIGAKDDMALVGVLSTQIIVDRFINHFRTGHGHACERTADVHHR
jgi:asparagine synthase (glutamine-hydrolysing)